MGSSNTSSDSEKRQKVQEYINDSTTVTEDSDVVERFKRIKSINQGMEVEITGINSYVKYNPIGDKSYTCTCIGFPSAERAKERARGTGTRLYGTDPIVNFNIYYETPFDEKYKFTLPTSQRGRISNLTHSAKQFLSELQLEVMSSDIGSVDNLSTLNSVTAYRHPDCDLTDGEIVLNDTITSVSKCEKSSQPHESLNCENLHRFLTYTIENHKYISSDASGKSASWRQAYISDVREVTTENQIVIFIDTPLGEFAAPYDLTYDTDGTFWDLAEYNTGHIDSLQGKVVYVRPRVNDVELYNMKRLDDDQDLYTRRTEQPIDTPTENEYPQLFSSSDNVIEVGVDAEYIWTIGVPTNALNHEYPEEIDVQRPQDEDKMCNRIRAKLNSLF